LFLMRCIEGTIQRFPSLYSAHNTRTFDEADAQRMVELNFDIWTLSDVIDNRAQQFNVVRRRLASHFDEKIGNLTRQRDAMIDELSDMGLSYEAVEEQCETSSADEVRTCVEEKAREDGGEDLARHVKTQMDGELYMELAFPVGFRPRSIKYHHDRVYQRVSQEIAQARAAVEVSTSSRWLTSAVRVCQQQAVDDTRGELERIQDELLGPVTVLEQQGLCMERTDTDSFCPEGTAPATRRSMDVAKGSAAAGFAYMASTTVFAVVGAVIGGLSVATGGMAAIAGGVAAGWTAGTLMPGNSAIAGATFLWFSMGPNQCACFPRDCAYDEDNDVCAVGGFGDDDVAGRNPFATAVPYMGLKCDVNDRAPRSCEMKVCVAEDYSESLEPGFFGKIGRHGQGIFNCLSKTGSPTASLAIARVLPNGANNTALARNELLTSVLHSQAGQ